MTIMTTIDHDTAAHRFSVRIGGSHAHLDYTLDQGVMTITHTWVPPAIGGRGVAAQLMAAALQAAHAADWSVHPQCSYAVAYIARHPEADKRHVEEMLDEALDESYPASDSPAVGGVS